MYVANTEIWVDKMKEKSGYQIMSKYRQHFCKFDMVFVRFLESTPI